MFQEQPYIERKEWKRTLRHANTLAYGLIAAGMAAGAYSIMTNKYEYIAAGTFGLVTGATLRSVSYLARKHSTDCPDTEE